MQDNEPGWCVPNAFYCARVWSVKRRQKIRIAVFRLDESTNHFQAQYEDEDGWHGLTEIWNGECMAVIPYGKNVPDAPEPFKYMTLTEAEDEQRFLIIE
jgi:hypothetical protein